MDADVIVIGAGAAGLACAHDLRDHGADVLVLEARDRVGGRIHTVRGFREEPFELGAMMVHGERAAVVDIAKDAGLTLEHPDWRLRGESFVVMDGELRHWSDVVEKWWDVEDEIAGLGGRDIDLRTFLTELGWPAKRRAVSEELFAQFWCADPTLVSAEGIARVENSWASGEDNLVVREGYDCVPEFLARGVRVELGVQATTIGWRRGHVRITTHDGRSFSAGAAVVSVPPTVVASGGLVFDPGIGARKEAAVAAIPLGSLIRVVAQLVEPAPTTGRLNVLGPEGGFWSVDERMVTVWIGGPSAARFSGTDPVDIVLRGGVAFPWLERSRIDDVCFADWGADPLSLGGYSYPRAGALDAPATWAEPVDHTLFFCGEGTCGDVHPATVHGAVESGRRAGAEVASVLTR